MTDAEKLKLIIRFIAIVAGSICFGESFGAGVGFGIFFLWLALDL